MLLKDVVKQLQLEGFVIEYNVRSDGGLKITKINGVSYSGAKGNAKARSLLGVELSEAQISQRAFNVDKYIKGYKKPKWKMTEDMKKAVKRVQRAWRKNKVNGKLTMRKARWHLKHEGKRGLKDYLAKMERYGEGLAYLENVNWLVKEIRNVARGLSVNGGNQTASKYLELAEYILSIADTFREAWINPIYQYLYEIRENGYSSAVAEGLLQTIYSIMH